MIALSIAVVCAVSWRESLATATPAAAAIATEATEPDPARAPVVVGSKMFTENRILGEIIAQLLEAHDIPVRRRLNLGGTLVVFSAMQAGEVDVYPEYTGTAWSIVLQRSQPPRDALEVYATVAQEFAAQHHIHWLMPFGFSNSYALAMTEARAQALGIRRISDLRAHAAELTFGFSHEFLNREDGYPGLAKHYALQLKALSGLEHGLAYEAVNSGRADVIDTYTTDGKLARYAIRLLEDDQHFFPPYDAAPIVREDALRRYPQLRGLLNRLGYRFPSARMQKLNAQVEDGGHTFAETARAFLVQERLVGDAATAAEPPQGRPSGLLPLLSQRGTITLELVGQHLVLTLVAVLLAIAIAVPAGILITRRPLLAQGTLGAAGVIQTIPSLALLAFMIPLPGLGLGAKSAVAALFLYALLPILRNTYTGIKGVSPDLLEAARGMGLRGHQILWYVELPLASRTIMAGIRTATVISIGVATLAAFVGAGGLGEPIITGLQLNDTNLILSGALPAAGLAVLVDVGLGALERKVAVGRA